jgi:hypothetical protein
MTELRGEGQLIVRANVYADGEVIQRSQEPPKLTGMGFEVANSFTINESEPVAGPVREYELLANDKVVWTGMGDDRADALLEAIAQVTDQGNELPDS